MNYALDVSLHSARVIAGCVISDSHVMLAASVFTLYVDFFEGLFGVRVWRTLMSYEKVVLLNIHEFCFVFEIEILESRSKVTCIYSVGCFRSV